MFMSRPAFHRIGVLTWKSRESVSAVTASPKAVLGSSSPESGDGWSGSSRSVICWSFFISERSEVGERVWGVQLLRLGVAEVEY